MSNRLVWKDGDFTTSPAPEQKNAFPKAPLDPDAVPRKQPPDDVANRFIYERRPATPKEFVEYWAARYNDPNEELYTTNINGPQTDDSMRNLFHWKIGNRYFETMLKNSVEPNFISRMEEARQLPPATSAKDFLLHFPKGGAIHRIFWLHCWHPHRFPIYDQHVHRAMIFITERKLDELVNYSDRRKIECYLDCYLSFFEPFRCLDSKFEQKSDGIPERKADRALMAFGKDVKSSKS